MCILFFCIVHMLNLEKQCIIRDKYSDKLIRFVADEGVFWLPDAEIAVVWKWSVLWRRANQIGNKMMIPLRYERWCVDTIDWSRMIKWLSLYQEYDEESDSWKTFLWKYPWGEEGMQVINDLSKQRDLGISIQKVEKFVQVIWAYSFSWADTLSTLPEALWFLVGICLWYGAPKNKTDQTIATWQVNLPCLWEIMRHETMIHHALEVCRENGIFVVHSDVQHRDLAVQNWTIHDNELIAFLRAIWLNEWPLSLLESTTERLVRDSLQEEWVKWDYVLKFVGK